MGATSGRVGDRSGIGRCWTLARGLTGMLLAAVFALALGAPTALASTTTINFDTPVVSSPVGLGSQYSAEGVTFNPNVSSLPIPDDCSSQLYHDPTHARSGEQVAYSFCQAHGEDFDNEAEILGRLSDFSNSVSVYAGAPGGTVNGVMYGSGMSEVTLTGYNVHGAVVASDTATVGADAKTLMTIATSSEEIAYFAVQGPIAISTPLEIDDLSFEVPSTPPPPQIGLEAGKFYSAAQSQSDTVEVGVERFNGANNAVNLAVSGLPSGVTVAGSEMIPAGSDATELIFAVAPNAPASSSEFTITATSTGVSGPVSAKGTFAVVNALGLTLGAGSETERTIALGVCSNGSVTITSLQELGGSGTLTLTSSGATEGLTATLSSDSISRGKNVSLSFASNGSGGSGEAKYTVTENEGSVPSASVHVYVQRSAPTTTQGIYVTQGTQPDYGHLEPSGTGASGRPYAGVTLVAGKTTIVRVYGDAAGTPAGLPGAVARLYGYDSHGKALPGSPLSPDYGPSTLPDAHASGEVVSDSELEGEANAYTFTLPESWTSGGYVPRPGPSVGIYYPSGQTIQLVGETEPYAGAGQIPSCHTSNRFTLNNIPFQQVGIGYDADLNPVALIENGKEPPPAEKVFQDTEAITPLPNGDLGIVGYFGSADISYITDSHDSAEEKNEEVLTLMEKDFGNVSHSVGVTSGTAYGLTNSVPGNTSAVDGNGSRPLTSVAHEVMHQYGLVHASPCNGGGAKGQVAEAWPPDERGELDGIAVNTTSEPYDFIANGLNGFAAAYDPMSYCAQVGGGDPNDWISPRNWTRLIEIFGVNPTAGASSRASAASVSKPRRGGSLGRDPLAADAQLNTGMLRVIGYANSQTGTRITSVGPAVGGEINHGSLDPAYTLSTASAGGQKLGSVPMYATSGGHIDNAGAITQLTAEIPAANAQSLTIALGGKALAHRVRPAHAPIVRVLSPTGGARVGRGRSVLVRWSTKDREHVQLTVAIDYSRDGGRSWRTIYAGADNGRATLPSFYLTASRRARLRVRVNDGFNEAIATSRAFTALGAPPRVAILTHFARNASVAADAPVALLGGAVDQLAHTLSGHSLHWYDGSISLGYGPSIETAPLPSGVNHIRLVARDSAGRTATASLTLTVAPLALPGLTLKFPRKVSAKSRTLTFSGSASTPTTLTISHHAYTLNPTQASFTLKIPRSGRPLTLAASVSSEGEVTPFAVEVIR
ncbi:MAG: hypothetical protein WBQ21_08390 [Solirubrobacteraceae bacterium]